MSWNADGTYTWAKSGETMSAAKMASDFNMTPPAKKKLQTQQTQQTTSAQPQTQQTASLRPGMQQDGTYVTPSGLTFPKEYAAGVAAGRPYRIDQSGGAMTVTWQDENPFQNQMKAGASGQAMLDQKTLATDPSLSFQDQSGKTFATISSPHDMSDVQVQRIYSDKSGNEYATITSSVAGGTKVDVKRSPQIGSGNVYLSSRPIFEKDPNPTQTKSVMDNMLYNQSIPDYKPLTSNIPGIGYITGFPDFVESKYPSILKDNPIGYYSGKAVKGFAAIPAGIIGGIDTAERYGRVALDQPATGQFEIAKMFSSKIQKQESEKYKKPLNLPQVMAYEGGQVVGAFKSDPLGFTAEVVGSMVIAGGITKIAGRTSGVVRTVGRKPLPIEKYGYRPEIGYPINPTPTSAKNVLKSFEDNTLFPKPNRMSKSDIVPYVPQNAILPNTKLTGSQKLMYTGWETDVPAKVGKKYLIEKKGSSETQGMYGAPVMQTSYTKISSSVSDSFKNVGIIPDFSFGIFKKPTMVATTVDSIKPVPKSLRNKIGSKEFIETKSEAGVAYMDLYKAEYQAVLGYGQEVKVTGKNFYTKFGGIGETHFLGRRIPITEQKTTGIRNIGDKPLSKSKPSKSGSYDVSSDPYKINAPYMTTPVTSKKSEYSDVNVYKSSIKTTYKPSTKSSTKSSTVSNSGSRSSSPKTTGSSMNLTSIIGSNPYTKSTPKYKTTKTTTTYTGNPNSKTTSVRTLDYTPSGVSYRPTSTSRTPSTSITTGTPTTSRYTPPKYIPPTYKTPTYKIPKFKLNETKPVKSRKYKPGSLFEFKEKTKSRSIGSILGGDLKPSRKKLILTKNKPRIVKKKIVRRKR